MSASLAPPQRIPPPHHLVRLVERDLATLSRRVAARQPRLERALARGAAFNPVARERLFEAITEALAPEIAARRLRAARHHALLAEAPTARGTGSYLFQRLLCLAGKAVGQRVVVPVLEATRHAATRFLERSRPADMAAFHAALAEAARHADAVLLAHLDGPCAPRLRRGEAPILLPAGEGAFLGWISLLPPGPDGWPDPRLTANTWVHEVWLGPEQLAARDVLRAGLPPAVLPEAIAEAWAGLRSPAGGLPWNRPGLPVTKLPTAESPASGLIRRTCPPVAAARLAQGLACPDALAADLPHARRALAAPR